MEKIIFFGLVIPIFIFVLYLGGKAIMTGFVAKSNNKSNSEINTNEETENSSNDSNWVVGRFFGASSVGFIFYFHRSGRL